MIPSTIRRSSPNGRPRRPSFDGSNGLINDHCASLKPRKRDGSPEDTTSASRVNPHPYRRHALEPSTFTGAGEEPFPSARTPVPTPSMATAPKSKRSLGRPVLGAIGSRVFPVNQVDFLVAGSAADTTAGEESAPARSRGVVERRPRRPARPAPVVCSAAVREWRTGMPVTRTAATSRPVPRPPLSRRLKTGRRV